MKLDPVSLSETGFFFFSIFLWILRKLSYKVKHLFLWLRSLVSWSDSKGPDRRQLRIRKLGYFIRNLRPSFSFSGDDQEDSITETREVHPSPTGVFFSRPPSHRKHYRGYPESGSKTEVVDCYRDTNVASSASGPSTKTVGGPFRRLVDFTYTLG